MEFETHYGQGVAAFRAEDFAAAARFFEQSAKSETDPANANFMLGMCYIHLQKWTQSINAFQKVTLLAPQEGDAYLNMGYAFYQLQNYDQAVDFIEKALMVGLKDNSPEQAYYNLGLALQDRAATTPNGAYMGRYEPALRAFEKVLELNPGHAAAYFQIGCLVLAMQQFQDAIEIFENLVSEEPDNPHPLIVKCWTGLATAHCMLDHYPQATACMRQALKLEPRLRELAAADPIFNKMTESPEAEAWRALFV